MVSRIIRGTSTFNHLQQRGETIAEELEQTAATFNLDPAAARNAWLNQQWDHLNRTAPQVDLPYRHTPPRTTTRQVIDPRLILTVTGANGRWGLLSNRPHSWTQILEALHDAAAVDRWEQWLDRIAPDRDLVELTETMGPLGPVYAIGNRGRHRAMLARAAALPALDALVTSSSLPRAGQPIYWPAGGIPADRATRQHYAELRASGLATLGLLDSPDGPILGVEPALDCDTAWAFDPPALVPTISAAYRTAYPDFGTNPKHAAMLQPRNSPSNWLSF